MVEDDIHKIWTIWGENGLLVKLGPERTIRELKKRCDAGAIIGCTLYKLLIDKWLNIALTAGSIDPVTKEQSDPHEAGPALQFMLAAGEDELVKKVEALREKHGDTIPRSVQLDLRDEFNLGLEKKVGRRIPLTPTDASKKDIEDSKRISASLGTGEITPVKAAPTPPEKEKPKPSPEAVPPPAKPETPVKVTPPTLELMEKEIRERAEKLRKKKASGELEAGEPKSQYAQSHERVKGREAARSCFEHVLSTGKSCARPDYYVSFVETIARYIRDKKTIPELRIKDLNRLREIKPTEFNFGVYDFLVEKVQEHQKVSGELKTQAEKAITKQPKYETARRIIQTVTPPGTESEEKLEISSSLIRCPGLPGFGMCKYCMFKYTVTSTALCPYKPEFKGTIGEGDIKKIAGIVARETGEPERALSKSFQEYIRRIEQVKGIDSLPDLKDYFENVDSITVLTVYDKLQLKQFIIQRMQDIINYYEKGKPKFPEQYREGEKEYKIIWTVLDFDAEADSYPPYVGEDETIAKKIHDELKKKGHRVRLNKEVIEKGHTGFRETNSNEKRDENADVITEPRNYSQWTFADFEGFIQSLEDIEDLEELYEYIDASDKLSENEAETLRNLVNTRIKELSEGYAELAKIR